VLRVTKTATQELAVGITGSGHFKEGGGYKDNGGVLLDSQAKKPSSSSLRLGAGKGAPGPSSEVGSLT